MADLPKRSELFQRWRDAALASPGTRISARMIDLEGSDLNLLANANVLMGELIVSRLAEAIAGCFEDSAEGDALDRVISDRKGLARKAAAPPVVDLVLERPTFVVGAGSIPGGPPGSIPAPARVKTNRGIVYQLLTPATFGATALGPITIRAQSELAGLAYEVDKDQTWSWIDVPFDETITINNPVESAGGADEETSEQYRARAKQLFPSLRRGTLGAIEFGAKNTSGVATATVVEPLDADGIPTGFVEVYALDPVSRSNEALAARTQLQLLKYRAGGIPASVRRATIEYINVRFSGVAWDTAKITDTEAGNALVRARVVSAIENQAPDARLYRATIIAAARSVVGFIFEDSDLIEPAATLIPTPRAAFRTKAELITIE